MANTDMTTTPNTPIRRYKALEYMVPRDRQDEGRQWITGWAIPHLCNCDTENSKPQEKWWPSKKTMTILTDECERVGVDPATLCEYVGKDDDNGTPIYTNDIVECGNDKDETTTGVVVWSQEELCYKVTTNPEDPTATGWQGLRSMYLTNCHTITITGNIHDNPLATDA